MDGFQSAATALIRECFEGKPDSATYTWFVEGKEAILPTLDSIDAPTASLKSNESTSSLAGHASHILFALRGANAQRGGAQPEGTWEDSWAQQSVTEDQWNEVRENIRTEYLSLIKWFEENQDWSAERIHIGALSMLPHMAYHLGAMLQIVRIANRVS